MRSGEVCSVRHLTLDQAQRVVRAGNLLFRVLQEVKLESIELQIGELADRILTGAGPGEEG
jgi:hypothetical protein